MKKLDNVEMSKINGGDFIGWIGEKAGELAHHVCNAVTEPSNPGYLSTYNTHRLT